jgi:hypothetical protein
MNELEKAIQSSPFLPYIFFFFSRVDIKEDNDNTLFELV